MLAYIITPLLALLLWFGLKKVWSKNKWIEPKTSFPAKWRIILTEKVAFYNSLNKTDKNLFEYKTQEFLLNCRITGVETSVDLSDKLLIASSAIIPILPFPDWKYINLSEVLLYPGHFDENFKTGNGSKRIMGMVGTGYMEGKIILSKKALHKGFENVSDKKNTAIHEFVHLIDKMDGSTDGIPELLLDKQYTIPWLDSVKKKIEEIYENNSDINPYGATSKTEFFAVISEYFFEKPALLSKKHPELYLILEKIFKQKMRLKKLKIKKYSIGRNSPCPCDSGKKYKYCCGKK